MSWDVVVMNLGGSAPRDAGELPEDYKPDPLGPAGIVRESISKYLPGVDWSDPTWGMYDAKEFSIEFNTGKDDPIDLIMLHVRGGGDPIPSLMRFAIPNKWSLLDSSTGEFLDFKNPSQEGWTDFKTFRDRVAREYGNETETK